MHYLGRPQVDGGTKKQAQLGPSRDAGRSGRRREGLFMIWVD
jgi:hypothetical protein